MCSNHDKILVDEIVEETMHDTFNEKTILKPHEVRKHLCNMLSNETDLLAPCSGEVAHQYILSAKKDEAYRLCADRANKYPCILPSCIQTVSNLTEMKIKKLLSLGLIDCVNEGGKNLITNEYLMEVKKINEEFIPVDDLVQELTKEIDSFKIRIAAHRRDLEEYLSETGLLAITVDNSDYKYPIDAKLMGLLLPVTEVEHFTTSCSLWLRCYKVAHQDAITTILADMEKDFPQTAWYIRVQRILEPTRPAVDMLWTLLKRLNEIGRELPDLTPDEIEEMVVPTFNNTTVRAAEIFSTLIYKGGLTRKRYVFDPPGTTRISHAYPREAFLYLIAAVLEKRFWDRNDLVNKAIKDRRCANLWVYVMLHLVAAWRSTDYVRLPVPRLQFDDRKVLDMIATDAYPKECAVLVSELYEMQVNKLRMKPSKSSRYGDVPPLYFCIPEKYREQVGIILSIAAAHYGLNASENPNQPFVQNVVDIATMLRFFGAEFVKACDNRNFSGKRANKAFMQGIQRKAHEEGISPYVAYAMASEVRSHKYGEELSRITSAYLDDSPMGPYSRNFIVETLFERGIMSFITHELLKRTYGDAYELLPVAKQTSIIKAIGLPAYQVEEIVQYAIKAQDNAIQAIKDTLTAVGSRSPKEALHHIALGTATSKDLQTTCLCSGAGVCCLNPDRTMCVGCLYEVRSKNVLLQYLYNYDRLTKIVRGKENSEFERKRAEHLLKNVITPGIVEIQTELNAICTKDEIEAYAWIMKERMSEYNVMIIEE